jgi:hypothetical protein
MGLGLPRFRRFPTTRSYDTHEAALVELKQVFAMISEE